MYIIYYYTYTIQLKITLVIKSSVESVNLHEEFLVGILSFFVYKNLFLMSEIFSKS